MNQASAPYSGTGQEFPLYQQQVAKFKQPHGVKIGNKLYSIRFLVAPYNCSIKFCGRLTPHVFKEDGTMVTYLDQEDSLVFQKHEAEIMAEFSEWIASRPFPVLSVNNPFFPGDGGNYGVNQFVYADAVDKEQQGAWYNNFPKLITILEKYGWKVHKGPEFYNITYNSYSPTRKNKESRIYILTPPKMVGYLKNQ